MVCSSFAFGTLYAGLGLKKDPFYQLYWNKDKNVGNANYNERIHERKLVKTIVMICHYKWQFYKQNER